MYFHYTHIVSNEENATSHATLLVHVLKTDERKQYAVCLQGGLGVRVCVYWIYTSEGAAPCRLCAVSWTAVCTAYDEMSLQQRDKWLSCSLEKMWGRKEEKGGGENVCCACLCRLQIKKKKTSISIIASELHDAQQGRASPTP